ncbi:BREX-1 system adenine-specific DNA-methyltransferase PglX [uncultured Veillonella sp.]|uniref:BREX-1 system adenine-specific DNA-methyltransferase PglX n=1 Tax=uncultured Veillonella sp. TaxID=159268 RepID=UPI002609AC76|nr:BREX-1 system adenine-specific DNA-methyltransferase PglX [uncultured Veillonella sp.]
MNKTEIRKFAEWAREKLISDIIYKAGTLGINENGIIDKLPQSTEDLHFFDIGTKEYVQISGEQLKQREALVKAIRDKEKSYESYKEAFDNLVEEIAYTWFNRLIAIRFMEVNNYLPSGIRVLSSDNILKKEPDLVTKPFDADLDLTVIEQNRVIELKDQNKFDELFRMLFIKQCNKLHEILPELFESTSDYTELLLTISYTELDGIVYKLVHDIKEADFNIVSEGGQVEIIGWLYQYYIAKKHDEIINIYKGTIKKADIPAATQLFTTDWVVRYMVDNSLGRYWIERNPNSKLIEKLDFFVVPKDGQINYVDEKIDPKDLTFFDPCMGSGHILVYAFDVLMEIYRECGYLDRDAALNIIQYNLFGMDIDRRAYQLAYFAIMMKARSYNRRALTQTVSNNLSVIEESNSIECFTFDGITNDKEQNIIGEYLINAYKDAQEIGTLQTIEKYDYNSFKKYLLGLENSASQYNIFSSAWLMSVKPFMLQLTKQAIIMSKKYSVVCTNPPYMNKLEGPLKKFVVDHYKPYSSDLFSVFMYRNFDFCKKNGYSAFMTPNVWMFIKSYEKLRGYIINSKSIDSLVQMAKGAFYKEATVDVCTFVLKNGKSIQKSLYFRLTDFKGDMDVQKEKVLEALKEKSCDYFYETDEQNFSEIPGSPIAYWVSNNLLNSFKRGEALKLKGDTRQGMATSDNKRFLRLWFEVDENKIGLNCLNAQEAKRIQKKWFPYNKGGEFRKWYGNIEYVINYENDGYEVKEYAAKLYQSPSRTIKSMSEYFKNCISWSKISSGSIAFRYYPNGFIFDVAGCCIFYEDRQIMFYDFGFLNSSVSKSILEVISPTLNYEAGHIATLPIIREANQILKVNRLVKNNIEIARCDWNSFETSWDFKEHPFIRFVKCIRTKEIINDEIISFYEHNSKVNCLIELCYTLWQDECYERFSKLKQVEEELNRVFIDSYSLNDELTPKVDDKDVTIRKANLQRDVKSFISYAVGCMFGRYSLDIGGLVYAGGEWDNTKYNTYIPDKDNCISITDEEYFDDDIVGRFCEFIETVFGKDSLEENLRYISNALGNRGNTCRDVIRNYFLNDFIKDHIKIYQKRPIYWLFDSGKQNGFKALCYMHRWNADTIGNMRVDYLHQMQKVYDKEIERMQEIIDNSHDNKAINKAIKRKEKLQKQLKETKDYDTLVAHLAHSRINIDLDDGVKTNYEKVQTSIDGEKLQILAKI